LKEYSPELETLFEKNFQKMAQEVLGLSKNMFRSLDPKIGGQLNTVLQIGAKKIEKSVVEKLLATQVANELSQSLAESYASIVSIASSFLFERLDERLQLLLEKTISLTKKPEEPTTVSEVQGDSNDKESEDQVGMMRRITLSESALTRTATKKRNRQSRKITAEEVSTITEQSNTLGEFLAEKDVPSPTESEDKKPLVHLTKNRATPAGNRKRPTRKPKEEIDLETEALDVLFLCFIFNLFFLFFFEKKN